MRPTRLAATVLALGLVLGGACSQKDPSAEDLREDLSESLQQGDDGLTEAQADCFAKEIVDEVGADELNDVDFDDTEPSDEVGTKIADAAVAAQATCDLEGTDS